MKLTNRSELEKRIIRAEALGQKWAEAAEAFYQLDETKKSVLADLMKDLDDGELSESKLERMARGQKEWKEHIQHLAVAKGEMLRAQVKYEAAVSWYEAARTTESTNRVKMQVLRDVP